jgi:hypothetical protein
VEITWTVDGEREEVDALSGLAGDDGREQRGVAELHDDCAVGELCEASGLERHRLAGCVDRTGYADCLRPIRTGHGKPFLSVVARRRLPVGRVRTRLIAAEPGRWRLTTDVVALCVSRNGERRFRSPIS